MLFQITGYFEKKPTVHDNSFEIKLNGIDMTDVDGAYLQNQRYKVNNFI